MKFNRLPVFRRISGRYSITLHNNVYKFPRFRLANQISIENSPKNFRVALTGLTKKVLYMCVEQVRRPISATAQKSDVHIPNVHKSHNPLVRRGQVRCAKVRQCEICVLRMQLRRTSNHNKQTNYNCILCTGEIPIFVF